MILFLQKKLGALYKWTYLFRNSYLQIFLIKRDLYTHFSRISSQFLVISERYRKLEIRWIIGLNSVGEQWEPVQTIYRAREWGSFFNKSSLRADLEIVLRNIVVQLLSHVWLFVTPWSAVCQAFLSLTISQSLPTFMGDINVVEFLKNLKHRLSPWYCLSHVHENSECWEGVCRIATNSAIRV